MSLKDRAAKWWVWSTLVAGVVVMATASAGCGVRIRTSGTETAPATAAAARGASVQAGQAGNPVVQAVAVVPAPGPGQQKVVLGNLGMTWTSCASAISAALGRVPGVVAYNVDFDGDGATVLYDTQTATVEHLKQAIAVAGYQVGNVRQVER